MVRKMSEWSGESGASRKFADGLGKPKRKPAVPGKNLGRNIQKVESEAEVHRKDGLLSWKYGTIWT